RPRAAPRDRPVLAPAAPGPRGRKGDGARGSLLAPDRVGEAVPREAGRRSPGARGISDARGRGPGSLSPPDGACARSPAPGVPRRDRPALRRPAKGPRLRPGDRLVPREASAAGL